MTFLAGLGGTSYSGPLSLQLFAQQPYAETPYKYVKHIETSNCLKRHILKRRIVNGWLCTDLSHIYCRSIYRYSSNSFIFVQCSSIFIWTSPFRRLNAAGGCSTHLICCHKDRVAELERAPPAAPEFWQRQGLVKVLLMELGCYRVQPSSISSTLKIWEYKYLLSNVHRIVRMLFVLFAVKLAR